MKFVMSIAAGVAIGYLVWQYIASLAGGKITGRLHKSTKDKKLAGVCGGLAEYLGVDPTIVRLAWALLMLGWGTGVAAYILCAILLPEESTEASR